MFSLKCKRTRRHCYKHWHIFFTSVIIFSIIQAALHASAKEKSDTGCNSTDTSLSYFIEKGYDQIQSGSIDQALISFNRVLESDADNLDARLGQAMIYSEQARHEDAFAVYDLIIKEYPQHAFAWNGRGLSAFNMENFDEALTSFQKATADQPMNGFFYESLAWTQMCRGEFNEAAKYAKKAVLMYDRNGETSFYPLLIAYFSYHESGDANNALRVLQYANRNKSSDQWPGPIIDYLNKKIDEVELISYVTNSTEETEAHTYIGLYMRLLGDNDLANRHLKWVCDFGNTKVFEYTLARTLQPQAKLASIDL